MSRSKISGWWYLLPLAIFLAFVSQATLQITKINTASEARRVATLPVVSGAEIHSRLNVLQKQSVNDAPVSIPVYFQTLAEIQFLELALQRWEHKGGYTLNQGKNGPDSRLDTQRIFWLKNDLVNNNQSVLSANPQEVVRAREQYYDSTMPTLNRGAGESKNFWVLARLYLWLALTAAPAFFVLRLSRGGLKVVVELAYRLPFWCLVWPFGIFKYPTNVNPLEQVRRFRQWLGATASVLLTMAPAAASAKSAGKSSGVEIQLVEQQGPTVYLLNGPPPRVVPSVVVGQLKVAFSGWVHLEGTSTKPGQPGIAMAKSRVIVTSGDLELFSQHDVKGTPTVDALSLVYRPSADYTIEVGRLFSPATDPVPAPFLQPTIKGPPIPVEFFMDGVTIKGKDGAVAFSAGVALDGSSAAANVKVNLDKTSFVRATFQQVDDLRIVLDGETVSGPHTIRAAAFYRTSRKQAGGYLLYVRDLSDELHKGAHVFTQVEVGAGTFDIRGGIGVPVNDNLSFTVEASENEVRARVRARF